MISRTRFTLIELLVVVAIIGILLSMLMPSLSKARDAAQTAVCLSNTKQFGVGIMIRADDQGGKLARSGGKWADELGAEAYLNTPTGTMQEQTSGNVLYCPSGLSDQVSAHTGNGGWNYIDLAESRRPWESNNGKFSWYGVVGSSNNTVISNGWRLNRWQLTSGGTIWPKLSLLENLEATISIHDGSQSLNTHGGDGGRIAARHKSYTRTNTLFFDGHAATIVKTTLLSTRSNDGDSGAEIIWMGSRAN